MNTVAPTTHTRQDADAAIAAWATVYLRQVARLKAELAEDAEFLAWIEPLMDEREPWTIDDYARKWIEANAESVQLPPFPAGVLPSWAVTADPELYPHGGELCVYVCGPDHRQGAARARIGWGLYVTATEDMPVVVNWWESDPEVVLEGIGEGLSPAHAADAAAVLTAVAQDSWERRRVVTWQVAARAPSRGKDAAVVLTPEDGPAVPLTVPQARTLQHDLLNAVLRLERAEREGVLSAKVRAGRARDRAAKKAAKAAEGEG